MAIISALISIITVAAIVSSVFNVIQAFTSPKPASITFGYSGSTGGSPRYGTFILDNTVSNELPVPILYGRLKIAGNVIWQTEPTTLISRIVGLSEGQINSITDVRANDVGINSNDAPGSSFDVYLGTSTQKADSRLPVNLRPVMELHNLAHIALTLKASEKIRGGNPTITSVCEGLLVETWQNGVWNTTKQFSRNPVACIRDFIINTRYGLGIPKANVDDATFGEIYDYCEEKVQSSNPVGIYNNALAILLHFDGPDGSVAIADGSLYEHAMTVGGSAQIDTAQFKFGGGSLLLGIGDHVMSAAASIFTLLKQDFTMECFFRPSAVAADQEILYVGSNGNRVGLKFDNGDDVIKFEGTSGGNNFTVTGTTPLSANTWYHLRGVRTGTTMKLFVNGVQEGGDKEFTKDLSTSTTISRVHVGRRDETETGNTTGWVDEVKVVVGVAMTTQNFESPDDIEARYRLDYTIDSQRPAQDVLNDMLASFMGFLIYSGNKIKIGCERAGPIVQYFGDGSTTKENATFDPNNIVRDSFAWNMSSIDDRPNRIKIQWVDPDQNFVKVYTQVEDRIDQDDRGTIITKDVSLLGITRQSQAARMAKLNMSIAKYAHLNITFSTRLESIHCEVGDVVAVTHQAARFTRRLFRITSMQEGEDETILMNCREYNAALYDDQGGGLLIYQSPSGPNLFAPLSDVTNLTLSEDNFLQQDGVFATNILVSWTNIPEDELLRLSSYIVQLSQDGGASFRDVAFTSSQQTSYRVPLGNVQTGVTFVVRVKTLSDKGAESAGATAQITIQGKITPISDVEDFDVSFAGDNINMTWSAVNDDDLFGYEIRMGNENSTWETAVILVTEYLGSSFRLFQYTTGTKKFFIKAIDNSQNYSENAASDSILITTIPQSNVTFQFDLWSRVTNFPHPLEGTLSSELDRVGTPDFNPLYYRETFQPKTQDTWLDLQSARGTYLALQNSSFVFGRELFVTSQESYETTAIDIGLLTTGNFILDMQTFSTSNNGFVSVDISTSTDDITYSAYTPFVIGAYTARYVKFKFKIQAILATTKVRVISATLTVDIPDKSQSFLNQSVGAGGSTIFLTGFTAVKAIVITTVGTSNLTPRIHDQSNLPTSFDVRLFDTSGNLQAGTVNIYVQGY